MIKKIASLTVLLSVAAYTLIVFQNCSRPQSSTTSNAETIPISSSDQGLSNLTRSEGGNGVIYDGKIYAQHLQNSTCKDGSDIKSLIKIENNTTTLIKDNCLPTNVLIESRNYDLYPHNLENLVYLNSLYDLQNGDSHRTAYLCRNKYKMKFKEGTLRVIGDFALKQDMSISNEYQGQIKFGIYNYSGDLKSEPFDSGLINLLQSSDEIDDHAFHVFNTKFTQQGRNFSATLKLRLNNMEGIFTLKLDDLPLSQDIPSIKDPPQFQIRVNCVKQ